MRLKDPSLGSVRRVSANGRREPLRVGAAVIRDYKEHGTRTCEIDFGRPFDGSPRLRFYRANRRDAIRLAQQKTRELCKHGDAALLLTTQQRIEASLCYQRLLPADATLTAAVEYWLQQHPAEHRGKTLAAVTEELIAMKKRGGRRERYIKDLGWKLAAFERAFPGRHVASVTTEEIEAHLATKNWNAVSYRSFVETIHVLFGFARRRRYIAINPCDALDLPRRDDKEPPILTVDQVKQLLGICLTRSGMRDCLPYLLLGTFAGIRPEQEIGKMDWASVSVDQRTIVVVGAHAKGRSRRVVNMSANMAAWLRLVAKPAGRIISKAIRFYRDRLKQAAGWRRWPGDVLRHSFASYHVAEHNDQNLTTAQLGHRNRDILWQHYRSLVPPEAAHAFWSIVPSDFSGLRLPYFVGDSN